MKFIFKTALLVFSSLSLAQTTYTNFDSVNPDMNFQPWNFWAGDAHTFQKLSNPDTNGNNSTHVGEFTFGADPSIGIGIVNCKRYFTFIDMSGDKTFSLKVWSDHETTLTLHIENQPDYGNWEEQIAVISATETNQWVTKTFDFETPIAEEHNENDLYDYNQIVIKMTGEPGQKIYFDALKGPNPYRAVSHNITPSPSFGAENVSTSKVIELVSDFSLLNSNFTDLDGPENDDNVVTSTDVTSRVFLRKNGYTGEDVPFTAAVNAMRDKISIYPDENLEGSTEYWFGIKGESIAFVGESNLIPEGMVVSSFTTKAVSSGPINEVLLDFEDGGPAFSQWDGPSMAVVENPGLNDPDGLNSSDYVAEYSHPGTTQGGGVFTDPNMGENKYVDFTETGVIRMKVWSAYAIGILLKFEMGDTGPDVETYYQMTEEETGKWTEITFNFSDKITLGAKRMTMWMGSGQVYSDDPVKFYIDDVTKSNVLPAAEVSYDSEGATNIPVFYRPSLSANFKFINTDDTPITDATPFVELRKDDASGPVIPLSRAAISEDGLSIKFYPQTLLSENTTYYYGIKDNQIEYDGLDTPVVNVGTSFQTGTAPSFSLYDDFEGGASETVLLRSLGDNPIPLEIGIDDPTDNSNKVIKWEKTSSWWGWERVHIELASPIRNDQLGAFSVRVWSPEETFMRFKVTNQPEGGDCDQSDPNCMFIETDYDLINANAWNTLYAPFDPSYDPNHTSESAYKHILIFLKPGDSDSAEYPVTFYIDDLMGPELQSLSTANLINEKFEVYPNPTSEFIHVNGIDKSKDAVIYDVNARKMGTYKLTPANNRLSVNHLNKGLYFIEIDNTVVKFIKH